MKNRKFEKMIVALALAFSAFAFADTESEIRDLNLRKEKLNSEIKKLNAQISETDSLIKADDSRYKMLQERYKADSERRKAEIDSLNAKIRDAASQLVEERRKQSLATNRTENVKSLRKALNETLVTLCKKFEAQVEKTIPWDKETRLDRVKTLSRDLESGNATEEEGLSRLKSLIGEEIKFGDEVSIINSPLTRKNGEMINAQILRIGNQWMVYSDENATVFGILVRKIVDGKIAYEWNEDLNLSEREIVKFALDVKQAKKPPQIVKLPVSLTVDGLGGDK